MKNLDLLKETFEKIGVKIIFTDQRHIVIPDIFGEVSFVFNDKGELQYISHCDKGELNVGNC